MPSKKAFLKAYREELLARYGWARTDESKLGRFMDSCKATLAGGATWNHDGEATAAAWRSAGGNGKPSLKSLRAMVD